LNYNVIEDDGYTFEAVRQIRLSFYKTMLNWESNWVMSLYLLVEDIMQYKPQFEARIYIFIAIYLISKRESLVSMWRVNITFYWLLI